MWTEGLSTADRPQKKKKNSPCWGSPDSNIQGKIIEDFLDDLDLCVLNNGDPTYCGPCGTLSHLDLTISDPSLFLYFNWKSPEDLCGSDHFPIFLNLSKPQSEQSTNNWKFTKANWDLFQTLCISHIAPSILDAEDPTKVFSETLIQCAIEAIPKCSAKPNSPKTPWFDDECKELQRQRKAAQIKVFRKPTIQNKCLHQKLRAQTRFLLKKKKTLGKLFVLL